MYETKENFDPLMSTAEAAKYLGTTTGVLAVYRCKGSKEDLPYFKDGKKVCYLKSTLDKYRAAHTIQIATI
jgi:hypothetical protein